MEQSGTEGESLRDVVRHVLLRVWDPIRLQELPEKFRAAALDEYDSYAEVVAETLLAHLSVAEIETYLFETETQKIGQKPENSLAKAAASEVVRLTAKWVSDPNASH